MWRPTAREQKKLPFSTIPTTAFQPFGERSSARQMKLPAALLIRMSMWPKCRIVRCTSSSTCSGLRTSTWTASGSRPACRSSALPASRFAALRLPMTILAPSSPSRFASARPRPVPPPVTIATCPSRRLGVNIATEIMPDAKIAVPVTTPAPEEFARLFEAVHQGVYIGLITLDATRTLSANPYLKLIFGYAAETPVEDVRPFDAERFVDRQAREAFIERLSHDRSLTDYLLRLRRADRTPMWVEVTANAQAVDGAIRIEALMRDVTERKRLEDQARDLYHQLLQAEKLAALGQTISGVAHELNNPLATILTWAERLAERPADDQTRKSTRLNSSHVKISYAVFCLKKKRQEQ